VKLNGTNVVQMTQQRKEAATQLVVPDFDFVIVSARYQQGFGQVKVDAADGAVVLFKAVNHGSDSVVPTVFIIINRVCGCS
jgi:hypothetical protein